MFPKCRSQKGITGFIELWYTFKIRLSRQWTKDQSKSTPELYWITIFFCDELHCIECWRGYVGASGKVAEQRAATNIVGGTATADTGSIASTGSRMWMKGLVGQPRPIPLVLTSVSSTTVPMTTRSNYVCEYLGTWHLRRWACPGGRWCWGQWGATASSRRPTSEYIPSFA